ncbi:MAG: hypothetical protein RBT56_08655 [Ignavibacteriaceae bacterium]|jgi:hypothetical protein|nr:hypothetical protein [Ignavibacteriaceae bacterium]
MTEDELREIATDFRQAVEDSDLSEASIGKEANIRVGDFPDSACAEISTVLGIVLTQMHNVTPLVEIVAQIENDKKEWYGTHHWLEHNGIIIDITADQFEMIKDKVIVSDDSQFHKEYGKQIETYSENFDIDKQFEWIKPIYDEIVPRYEAILEAKNKK